MRRQQFIFMQLPQQAMASYYPRLLQKAMETPFDLTQSSSTPHSTNFIFIPTIFTPLIPALIHIIPMEGTIKQNVIAYQQQVHHRQQLRQHIRPQTIDMLQINTNPSMVSRKACQSLYQDQLDRQLAARTNGGRVPMGLVAGDGANRDNRSSSVLLNAAAAKLYDNSRQFRDYDKEKDTKVKQHIDVNFNGGKSFFKASEQHEALRQRQLKQVGDTLRSQLSYKIRLQQEDKMIRDHQSQSLRAQQFKTAITAYHEIQNNKHQKQNTRSQYLRQIQEQRARNSSNDRFNYNNNSRHNPITNPIEYHIDNPYILKQIQDKKGALKLRL